MTVWVAASVPVPQFHPTAFLWGLCLIVTMLLMAWQAWTTESNQELSGRTAPADD